MLFDHTELKKTYRPGQQWEYNDPADRRGWELCSEKSEPAWTSGLKYRLSSGIKAGSIRHKNENNEWIVTCPHNPLYSTATMGATEYYSYDDDKWLPIID